MAAYAPYRFALISSRLSRTLEAVYGERFGLSRTEWRALALLAEAQGCSATSLVERSGMDAVAVHRAVKHLETLNLVARQSDEHDRRVKHLRLTARGEQVYQAVVPHALALEKRMLETLTADEARVLERVLNKLMAASFEAGNPPHSFPEPSPKGLPP